MKKTKKQKCKNGHALDDVKIKRVVNFKTQKTSYVYTCAFCKASMPVLANLIGNPFDIRELRDSYKDRAIMNEIIYALTDGRGIPLLARIKEDLRRLGRIAAVSATPEMQRIARQFYELDLLQRAEEKRNEIIAAIEIAVDK